jgi:hypothetical protein
LFGGNTVSDIKEVKSVEEEDEVVIGEKLSTEYRTKTAFKESAELRMVLYVVPAAIILITIAFVLSKLNY